MILDLQNTFLVLKKLFKVFNSLNSLLYVDYFFALLCSSWFPELCCLTFIFLLPKL